MGMSTYIEAFIPDTDPIYQRHKSVLLACTAANVSLPKETAEYFGEDWPETYLLDNKLEVQLEEGVHYEHYQVDTSIGFTVDLTKLPQGVTKLKFYNSW